MPDGVEVGNPDRWDATDVERVFRDEYGQVVATLVRIFGDITLAEDAVQDAFVVANTRWADDGIPPNPAGWIVTTARRRAIDHLRRASRGRELEVELATTRPPIELTDLEPAEIGPITDDRLRLIFTCCHPALKSEYRVALTLRLLGGLSVEEIARTFLVSEAAMAKRLVRAKHKINTARIPYRIPAEPDLPVRLGSVLAVVYLIYNAGAEDPARAPLRAEAIRLGRALAELLPDQPEVSGLIALMLLSESRASARGQGADVVPLTEQDRSTWDRALIDEGHGIVRACIVRDQPGPYQLQAAIQAVHCDADTFAATDWGQIVVLYDQLLGLTPTSVVAMNRAIAIGEAIGPGAMLGELEPLAGDLDGYHPFHAARGSAFERLGRLQEAAGEYRLAADLAPTTQRHRFLDLRANSTSTGAIGP